MTRRLVLTADDAGYDPDTNEAIVQLAREGRICAATVLAVAPDAAAFAALAAAAGVDTGWGVHAALSSDAGMAPWRPLSGAPSLADPDGYLPTDAHLVEQRASDDDVATELDVQITAVQGLGLTPARLDSHAGTLYGRYGHPFIAQGLEACARYGLGLRVPRELRDFAGPSPSAQLRELHATAVEAADQMGVRLPQVVVTSPARAQDLGSYEALRAFYIAALAALPQGTSELFLHPAPAVAAMQAASDQWVKREWELRLLRDPAWLDALAREQITLSPTW